MPLWTPASITTTVWYDASDSTTITTQTGVSSWADKSGNNWHLTQVTPSYQPIVQTAAINGKDVIRFDGSDDLLDVASFNALVGDAAFSVFAVYRKLTVNKGSVFGWGFWSGYGASGIWDDNNTYAYHYYNGAYYPGTTLANNTIVLFGYTKSSGAVNTTSALYRNGVSIGSGGSTVTPSIYNSYYFRVGNFIAPATGQWFNGDLAELIVVPSSLGTTDRQLIEGYLAWKWGTNGNLQAGHPYKYYPPGVPTPISQDTVDGDTGVVIGGDSGIFDNCGDPVAIYTRAALHSLLIIHGTIYGQLDNEIDIRSLFKVPDLPSSIDNSLLINFMDDWPYKCAAFPNLHQGTITYNEPIDFIHWNAGYAQVNKTGFEIWEQCLTLFLRHI